MLKYDFIDTTDSIIDQILDAISKTVLSLHINGKHFILKVIFLYFIYYSYFLSCFISNFSVCKSVLKIEKKEILINKVNYPVMKPEIPHCRSN